MGLRGRTTASRLEEGEAALIRALSPPPGPGIYDTLVGRQTVPITSAAEPGLRRQEEMDNTKPRLWDRYFSPDTPGSMSSSARAERWAELYRRFPDLPEMRVIDLGGYVRNWDVAPARPAHLTVVNLDGAGAGETSERPAVTVVGDACDLPSELFKEDFDLVYSNSVIEHVGGHWRRQAFARSVYRLAPHCWVQTPARTFPIEPHWMFPAFQFMPVKLRAGISRRWPYASEDFRRRTYAESVEDCLSVDLVSVTEMRSLFPDADFYRERFLGITKSVVAIR